MEEREEKSWTDKLVDFLFSKNNIKWLVLIILFAAILRFLITNNINFLGDEMVHGPHAIGILKTNVLSRMTQSIVWFYLTDISYKIFGVTGFSSRFLSWFFGIFSIPLVYLLGKEFYNKKTGLVAAFFLGISAYTIRYTLIEMDIPAVFFVLLASLFFIRKAKIGKFSYVAAFFLGIGILIKASVLFFIPGFLIWFYLMQDNPKKSLSKSKKNLIIFLIIVALLITPIFAYNYFLFKEKQIVDVYFSKIFNINREVYAYQLGIDKTFSLTDLVYGGSRMLWDIIKLDPIITLLGFFGVFLMFKEKKKNPSLLFLSILIPFIFLASSVLLQTHFVVLMPFLSIFAAAGVKKITNNFEKKKILAVILIITLLINLYLLFPHLTSQSAFIKTRNFVRKEIPDSALVVVDGRFYTGRTSWIFFDKNYLSSALILEANKQLKNYDSQEVQTELYFIECAQDDCGWGTIKDQPEFNQSMEFIADNLKQNAVLLKEFKGGGGYNEVKGQPSINIYKSTISIKPEIFVLADSTHYWWQYSVNYEKESFDSYTVKGFLDNSIDLFAHIILYISIFFAAISPIFIIFLWKKYN